MAYNVLQIDAAPSNVLPQGKAATALVAGNLVYMTATGTWAKADQVADSDGTRLDALGVCYKIVQANENIDPVKACRIRGFTSLTIGGKVYLSDTAGDYTQAEPTTNVRQVVGFASSATEIVVGITGGKGADETVGGEVNATTLDVSSTAAIVGTTTMTGKLDLNNMLDAQATIAGGASPSHIVKQTGVAGDTYTATYAGLSVKMYDADTTIVHAESEFAGLYVNLKQLSAFTAGGKSALISAHNYGSGGSYQVVDFGLRLFGDLVDGVEITGGTVTSAIKLDTATALTNILKLADGVGCAVGTTMHKDPELHEEAGFYTILVAGTPYQVPFYAAS